ncbi:HigA family addiction module antitoxin [Chenggangzhangella methanolivorans]|uniref:HigA family addiction module antitoxin n=1 Tax=Chenggangzhangella methanolivorans TaxID=1437009 RepID=UPI003613809C
MTADLSYQPDRLVSPGAVLADFLDELDISARELARRCGRSAKLMVEIIAGKAPVEPETALQLERVLGMSADIWLGLEARYRLELAKTEEIESMAGATGWASRFPLAELRKRGLMGGTGVDGDAVRQLLAFFGCGSVESCKEKFRDLAAVSYRHSPSFKSTEEALLVWLRLGERKAGGIACADFDKSVFTKNLKEARALSRDPIDAALPELERLCAAAGVAFCIVKPIEGIRLSGISRWLTPRKALIQQSMRHMANDHFWFTFFHEAAHLLLHSRKTVFLDSADYRSASDAEEEEANKWATNFLVPQTLLETFIAGFEGTDEEVLDFAERHDVAAGIVVGQLQNRGVLTYRQMNHLKVRFKWAA